MNLVVRPSVHTPHALRLCGWLGLVALLAYSGCARPSAAPAEPTSTPDAPAQAAQPAQGEDPAAKAASVFVVHQVPDFAAYLQQFAKNAGARERAGVRRVILARLTSDPGRVALHFSGGSLGAVNAFLESSEYDQLVESDQATNSSLLWIATDELDELPTDVPRGSVSLFKKFSLSDVDCAKKALIAQQAELHAQGVLGYSLHTTTVGTNTAILHLVAIDRASAERAYGGDALGRSLLACGASGLEQPVVADNQTDR